MSILKMPAVGHSSVAPPDLLMRLSSTSPQGLVPISVPNLFSSVIPVRQGHAPFERAVAAGSG